MVIISLDNNKYKARLRWESWSIKEFAEFSSFVIDNIPQQLKDEYVIVYKEASKYANDDKELDRLDKKLTEMQANYTEIYKHIELFEFYGKVISYLIEDFEDIDKIQSEEREQFYNTYCINFIICILFQIVVGYKNEDVNSFSLDDKEYKLPQSKDVMGTTIPFYFVKTKPFLEMQSIKVASAEIESGNIKFASTFLSLLALAEDNYSETKVLNLATTFESLPLTTFFNVFFSLHSKVQKLSKSLKHYSWQNLKGKQARLQVI